jgi:Glyoxalase-like domain
MAPANIDHVIILLPYEDLVNPPSWLTDKFTITPGGRHADGMTENKLVCFRDGSYLELVAFINDDPQYRAGHRWGEKKPGVIGFAFASSDGDAEAHFAALHERLNGLNDEKARYAPPVEGGRIRDDGQRVRWKVTLPLNIGRGGALFFCHDITPRSLRVPLTTETTSHPCGAYGIKTIFVDLGSDPIDDFSKRYAAILDSGNVPCPDTARICEFKVGRVCAVNGVDDPTIAVEAPGAKRGGGSVDSGMFMDGLFISPAERNPSSTTELPKYAGLVIYITE